MLRYVIKPYTSLDKYKEVDFKKKRKRSHSADGRAVGFWSGRQRGESRGPPSPPLPSAAAAPARTARRRRGAAGRPRDGPAAIISRGHGQRRASPGGQPQGPAAARRERAREGGKEEREKEGRKEGHHRSVPTCQFQPLLSARLVAIHTLSPWKRKRKKKNQHCYLRPISN